MKTVRLKKALSYFLLITTLLIVLPLVWLRWESGLPQHDRFDARQGKIAEVTAEHAEPVDGRISESVQLLSDSGLRVTIRVVRQSAIDSPVPVLLMLSGHRTGAASANLFENLGENALVGMDYPYDGPEKVKGFVAIAKGLPQVRRAVLDTVPAVSLVVDWLTHQAWADETRIVIVGASLGVPFAAAAAARDTRIGGVMLVHGAADNRLWLEVQVARQIDTEWFHYPVATILYWLAYGPAFDTARHIAAVSPRPVLIVGARNDERTPAGQSELLFDAAAEPKRLRWTDSRHVKPYRYAIIDELERIAIEEIPFLTSRR